MELKGWGFESLFEACFDCLQDAIRLHDRKAGNWSIQQKIKCTCGDCKSLKGFLASENKKELRWPLAKQRRRHIHGQLNDLGLPISHSTERTGSPLIIKKEPMLFNFDKKEYNRYKKKVTTMKTVGKMV
jgi:hypothetical protein